jgi:excisionase family DNA binding protein
MALVSVAEYATAMNIAPATVRRLAREGHIPAVKVGPRLWRIDPDCPLPRTIPIDPPTKGQIR